MFFLKLFGLKTTKEKIKTDFLRVYKEPQYVESGRNEEPFVDSAYEPDRFGNSLRPRVKLLYASFDGELCNDIEVFGYVLMKNVSAFLQKHPNERFIASVKADQIDRIREYIDNPKCIRVGGMPVVIIKNLSAEKKPRKLMKKLCCEFQNKAKFILARSGYETAESLNCMEYFSYEAEISPAYSVNTSELTPYKSAVFGLNDCTENGIPILRSVIGCHTPFNTVIGFSSFGLYQRTVKASIEAGEDGFIILNGGFNFNEKYGYAAKNSLLAGLCSKPYELPSFALPEEKTTLKCAVQAHIYSVEALPDILHCLNEMSEYADIYISTDSENKVTFIKNSIESKGYNIIPNYCICKNFGKDIIPFFLQMRDVADKYDMICHIHSKKAKSGDRNAVFRKVLLASLVANKDTAEKIFTLSKEHNAGLVYPDVSDFNLKHIGWDSCRELSVKLLQYCNLHSCTPDNINFPLGSMFWINGQTVSRIADSVCRFAENNDDGDMLCHAVLRLLPLAVADSDMNSIQIKFR